MSKEPEIVTRFREMLETSSEDDLVSLAYKSPAVHFALFMEILDKNKKWIRPTPNVLQLRTSEVIETLRERCPGVKIRIVEVKPRRAGCSTFALHCGYHEARRRPIDGLTIADRKENSGMLMERMSDYTAHDSFPWENRQTQDASHSLAWSNGSVWTIDSAENPDAGVGGTRQFGHFSECSKFPQTAIKNDVKTMTAALPSFNGADTICIAESTPEGAQGWFYGTFDEAMWLHDFLRRWEEGFRPEQVWIRVFAAWWEFDDNRRTHKVSEVERQHIEDTLTEEEREDREEFDLDYEQLAWRRETIETECDKNPKVFLYYYPKDPVSCWLASGSPRFDMQIVLEMELRAKESTPDTGWLVSQDDKRVSWQGTRDGTGDILIWEMPLAGLKYIVVLDPASNASQTIGADTDCHSLSVWRDGYHDQLTDRYRPAKRVARLKPPYRGEGSDVAGHAARLSNFYGRCIVAMEVNIGLGILELLQIAGIPLYKRKPLSHRTGKVEEQYGFRMGTKEEREALISGLATAIQDRNIDPSCPHACAEYKSFIRWPDGKSAAAQGKHDDDVLADSIAWKVMPSATTYVTHKAKHFDPPDAKSWRTVVNKW